MKRNPIPPRDPKFLLDPRPWTDGTFLEDFTADNDGIGFFHVTTNRDRVFKDGRLRSRQDVEVIGLGGGHVDKGHHVSFVTDWNRAVWLYESMKQLREQLEPGGSAAAVLKLVLEWTGFPDDYAWRDLADAIESGDWELEHQLKGMTSSIVGGDPEDDNAPMLGSAREWREAIDAHAERLNAEASTPERRYDLARWFERAMLDLLPKPGWGDPEICIPTVGFTAPFARFMQIDPAQMSIVQAAVREGAEAADIVPEECELRFAPKDIQLVAIDCQVRANCLTV
jgi:hypothetical protein